MGSDVLEDVVKGTVRMHSPSTNCTRLELKHASCVFATWLVHEPLSSSLLRHAMIREGKTVVIEEEGKDFTADV